MDSNSSALYIILLCVLGVLSVLGNGILLFVAYRKKSSLKPAEFFVVNLSISDLSMTVTLFPFAIPSTYTHMWVTIQVFNFFFKSHLVLFYVIFTFLSSRETRTEGKRQMKSEVRGVVWKARLSADENQGFNSLSSSLRHALKDKLRFCKQMLADINLSYLIVCGYDR